MSAAHERTLHALNPQQVYGFSLNKLGTGTRLDGMHRIADGTRSHSKHSTPVLIVFVV